MEGSKIAEFYRNKSILITGGTGFVGKLLVEKLLRVCRPKALYLLIRPKKSVEPQERLEQLFKSPVFDNLKSAVPDFKSRLILVSGDMLEPDLGLAEADRRVLTANIEVVFHAAATVKFDEALPVATKINVVGTKTILALCREMTNLRSVVYVSTAFSNCPRDTIEESFYEPPITSDNLIKLTECLKAQQADKIAPYILEDWPNTYAFTKAVAEDAVRTNGKGLPLAVFRPAIIVSTRKDPVPGWIDNLYGPIGVMVGYGAGLLRVLQFGAECKADVVPADMTINCMLAVGYKTSVCPPELDIPVYNFTTHKNNIIKWKDFMRICCDRGFEIPSTRTLWYYSLTRVSNSFTFALLTFLIHILPALLVDSVLLVTTGKPRALKIYKKIHKFSDVISYFSTRSWEFGNDNVNSLWRTLNIEDREKFHFDMSDLNWQEYWREAVDGIRLYMLEDKLDTLPYARKKLFVLWILHRTVQIAFFSSLAWVLWRISVFANCMIAT